MHAKSLVSLTTALAVITLAACQPKDKPVESSAAAAPAPTTEPAATPAPAATGTENMPMQKIDLTPGNGAEIKSGQNALVHYTGWLYDATAPENKGKKFDSSVDRNEPFEFPIGQRKVIAGWDEGVATMKIGGKRTLIIPAALGYGARGAGGVIPPNATLMFDVELLAVR